MHSWLQRLAVTCAVTCAALCEASAQVRPARIEGLVISDLDERPLKRAHVTLRPVDAGLTTIGVETDDKGNFDVRDVAPGRYSLVAERDGYLASAVCLKGALRMPPVISITAGQSLGSLTFRLKPWAVITGRIRFEDGEPAVNVRVDAYREYHLKGRHGYSVLKSAATNDRGEYRVHGLQPGSYYVAVAYERAPPPQGYREQVRVDQAGRELPALGFSTTFFPNTVKLSEASSVRMDYGREAAAIDIFLQPIRKVKIRGQIISGLSGEKLSNASIFLERTDAHNVPVLAAPAAVRFDQATNNFEIRDVTPGTYLMIADAADGGNPLSGRVPLTVPEQDIENLSLIATAQRRGAGKIRIEGGGKVEWRQALTAVLSPRSDHATSVSAGVRAGAFEFWVTEGVTYDIDIRNLPEDFYISGATLNGSNVLDLGLAGSGVSFDNPFEIVIDARGGKVAGQVMEPDGNVWSGASLMLVPDPAQGRLQSYREGYANQDGQFLIRGVAPGKYVLLAWLDDVPCDVYDVDNLGPCRVAGMAVTVAPGGQENVTFTAKRER